LFVAAVVSLLAAINWLSVKAHAELPFARIDSKVPDLFCAVGWTLGFPGNDLKCGNAKLALQ
jgi:hypothetical protein